MAILMDCNAFSSFSSSSSRLDAITQSPAKTQGLPTCPLPSLDEVRTRFVDLNCWNLGQYFGEQQSPGEEPQQQPAGTDSIGGGATGKVTTIQPTNLQKFYKKHKKMPAFRGRRGWCGCLQVRKKTV